MRSKGVPFVKGDKRAGRKRGSRNFVPSSVRGAFLHLADVAPELFEQAIRKDLMAKPPRSFPYIQLAAYYLDGKPVERVMLQGTTRMLFLSAAADVDLGGTSRPALQAHQPSSVDDEEPPDGPSS